MTALRVVQWATGNIGARALRGVIEHPELTLAGVYVTSAAKAGQDAGDLCGLPATGVAATNDIDQILALGADCVLYMPAACDFDEVCALLASGANIVTTRGEFHHPDSIDPAVRAQVEADVRNAYLDLNAAAELVRVAQSRRDLARDELAQSTDRFASGVADTVEVTQAQEVVASAESEYIADLNAHNLAKASVARAIGQAEKIMRDLLRSQ